ncbi:MAG TPA: class I SAM-dependent methyltransferase [Rhizomicrobium sp.]|jgi:hypothetical protein|nr:class I SAM-dependent methyltransferase [Rhizomicrobium sp.]
MLGSALRYVWQHPRRLAGALAEPAVLVEKLHDHLVQRWEYRTPVHFHEAAPDWERTLHDWLGAPWPCCAQAEFPSLWPEAISEIAAKGINAGPESFAGYNDGDRALVRAIWCLVRHLEPLHTVETGVAHGLTSRFILNGLERNRGGTLWSIDRPPLDPTLKQRIGIAVPERLRERWTLIAGSSRRRLPGVLAQVGQIDLFVHDSLHTEQNVRFELARAWAALKPGGALVVDDIDSNGGYGAFLPSISGFRALVCESEPDRPDERRFNRRGLFAVILKDASFR